MSIINNIFAVLGIVTLILTVKNVQLCNVDKIAISGGGSCLPKNLSNVLFVSIVGVNLLLRGILLMVGLNVLTIGKVDVVTYVMMLAILRGIVSMDYVKKDLLKLSSKKVKCYKVVDTVANMCVVISLVLFLIN